MELNLWHTFFNASFYKYNNMERETTTNVFSSEKDDSQQERFAMDSDGRKPENIFIDRPLTSDTEITQVNGHHLPEEDDDEDEEEDDLVLGDEDDLDEADLKEDEIDVEIDDDMDDDLDEDDLVLDADDDEEEEDDL